MSAAEVLAAVAAAADNRCGVFMLIHPWRPVSIADLLSDLERVEGNEVIESTEILLDLQLACDRARELSATIKEAIGRIALLAESAKIDAPTPSERRAAAERARGEKAAREAQVRARAPKVKELSDRVWAWRGYFTRTVFAARAVVARRRAGLSLRAAARAIGCSASTLRNIEEDRGRSDVWGRWQGRIARAYGCDILSRTYLNSKDDDLLDVDLDVLEAIVAAQEEG